MAGAGKLVVVATPIGNLGDLSSRACETLSAADFWIVEDTRQSAKLRAHLGIKKRMVSMHEHTQEAAIRRYADEIASGTTAALVTDGGCPVVSDPGAFLVDLCHEKGIEVDAVPGPSAVTTALMVSGFFAQRFVFLGFAPRKPGDISRLFEPYSDSTVTLVLFESALRAEKLLEAAFRALGPRRYAICRELTKAHQQVYRGRLPSIPNDSEAPRKGEWTLAIEGRRGSREPDSS